MGTNYYAITGDERLHIGKSSAGWAFALRIYGPDGPDNIEEWTLRIERADQIVDEYGGTFTPEFMLAWIEHRAPWGEDETTPFGYASWAEFYERNDCYRDHHTGLMHHVPRMIGPRYCNRGPGTFDYCRYEFS